MRKIGFFLLGLVMLQVTWAVSLSMTASPPKQYVVKSGDTLWSISTKYLRKPWQWPQLWHANPDIKNPDLIYPGDELVLYRYHGQPALQLIHGRVYKLHPQVKSSAPTESIAVIPFNDIKPFIQGVQVVSPIQMANSAYVVAVENGVAAGDDEHIFARQMCWENRYYSTFRPGKILTDPITHEVLGIKAINTGEAALMTPGDPATLMVTKSYREIEALDRVLPMPARISANDFYPHPPIHPVMGQIIAIMDDDQAIVQYQVVIINLGAVNGMHRGDVLAIYQKGEYIQDPTKYPNHFFEYWGDPHHPHHKQGLVKLPDETVGDLIIFRVFDRVSYALVMNSTKEINKKDYVTNP